MNSGMLFRTSALAVVLAGAFASSVHAQDAAGDREIEEIVVTAQTREQSLQDVPIVVTSVSGELLQDAGVRDIRDLTVWVFKREVADQIIAHATYEDWSDGLLAMFVWMQNHPEETRSVVSSIGMEDLQIFLHKQLRAVMEPIVDQHSIDLQVTEDDRVFVTDHFTLAILGHVSQWLATGMSTDPYILTERIARVLDGQVRRSLEALAASPIPSAQRA